MSISDIVVLYKVEYFHKDKWITVIKPNVDLEEVKMMLKNCYEIDPYGEYRIVKIEK